MVMMIIYIYFAVSSVCFNITYCFQPYFVVICGRVWMLALCLFFCSIQIQEITSSLLTKTDYVDWRRFLVALVEPIPVPTQQELLDTCARFHEMDQKNFGYVTREQYDRVGDILNKKVYFVHVVQKSVWMCICLFLCVHGHGMLCRK